MLVGQFHLEVVPYLFYFVSSEVDLHLQFDSIEVLAVEELL